MRRAYVLRLTSDASPARGHLSGWIEEVETGRELRFRTTQEFLLFLGFNTEPLERAAGDRCASTSEKE